jgi:preprotein translocase subunit SecA
MPDGEAIEAGIVTRSIESAQRKVEARNFDMRKQLLEYDDVANDQRKVVYQQRNELLDSNDITEAVDRLRAGVFAQLVRTHVPAESVEEQWDLGGLNAILRDDWGLDAPVQEWAAADPNLNDEDILGRVAGIATSTYQAKVETVGRENWTTFERSVMLQSIDQHWREHLAALDHLRQGIHLRGYAQKNPKQEYKREAFELFQTFLENVKHDVTKTLMTVRVRSREEVEAAEAQARKEAEEMEARMQLQHALANAEPNEPVEALAPFKRFAQKVGRNDPCPCGSGKKYKQCHGKLA